jgi:chemotaxis response regulator CheB
LPRVLTICRDSAFCQRIVEALQAEPDFDVSLTNESTVAAMKVWRLPRPDLFILEAPSPHDAIALVQTLKLLLPEVPVFLITQRPSMQSEKEVLAQGVDAVFEKSKNFLSLIMNAKAVCEGY